MINFYLIALPHRTQHQDLSTAHRPGSTRAEVVRRRTPTHTRRESSSLATLPSPKMRISAETATDSRTACTRYVCMPRPSLI